MTRPVYKIETLTGAVSDHTITSDEVSVYSKEVITDGVGHFAFTVPTKKGSNYVYDDIALNDTVKIWYGYDSVSGDPDFIGKVGNISAPLNMESGYVRVISGLSQGEILLRRFKKNKYYDGTGASTIVTEWANDLSLGTGDIVADATAVTLEVETKSYFDLLRFISDYWASAGTQIKKDFYVDVDGDLVWKARPFRSGASVETLTVGSNIMSYRVTRDVDAVKNEITVYGAAEAYLPDDKDSWTDSLTNWTASAGSLDLNGTKKVGTYSVRCYTGAAADTVTFKRTFDTITIRDINEINCWMYAPTGSGGNPELRLLAPDTSNYFTHDFTPGWSGWKWVDYQLGPDEIYDVDENPDGVWTESGSPNWWDIQGIQFHSVFASNGHYLHVDSLYFYPDRWTDTASDATSQSSYGQRDMEVTDDKLHSDGDCEKRSETLLYQRKDPPVQIEVTTPRNTNILVGDRIPMTIPAENISAANYDVISVAHNHSLQGCITKAVMVNSANIREPVTRTELGMLSVLRRQIRQLGLNERGVS